MITKERLEELIKEEATIWHIAGSTYYAVKLTKNNEPEIKRDTMLYCYVNSSEYRYKMSFENLFETKEEAEWELEFGNITRTETLKLPTFEEFCNGHKIHFYTGYIDYLCSLTDNHIRVLECYGMGAKPIFDEPLTKENYLEACKLCKKLFLGEEV